MCGQVPCTPMTDACTWSFAWLEECRMRHLLARELSALAVHSWDEAVKRLKDYEAREGSEMAAKLKAEIKRLKG